MQFSHEIVAVSEGAKTVHVGSTRTFSPILLQFCFSFDNTHPFLFAKNMHKPALENPQGFKQRVIRSNSSESALSLHILSHSFKEMDAIYLSGKGKNEITWENANSLCLTAKRSCPKQAKRPPCQHWTFRKLFVCSNKESHYVPKHLGFLTFFKCPIYPKIVTILPSICENFTLNLRQFYVPSEGLFMSSLYCRKG